MRRYDPVDLVLIEAASTLLRKPSRRPQWLPAGYPMALILTQKRKRLLDFLADDRSLRESVRAKWQTQLEFGLLEGVDASTLEDVVLRSADPQRLVAAALLASDDELAAAASWWAEDSGRIPIAPPSRQGSAEQLSDERAVLLPAPHPAPEAPIGTPEQDSPGRPVGEDGPDIAAKIEAERTSRRVVEEKLDWTARELDAANATVRRLEAANLDLRAKIPSRADKQRTNKQLGDLQREAKQHASLVNEHEALKEERDQLLRQVRAIEVELDEAVDAARRKAEGIRQRIEERMRTSGGRAEYLRHTLDDDIEEAKDAEARGTAREATRSRRRSAELADLRALLDSVFPNETDAHPVVAAAAVTAQPALALSVGADRCVRVVPFGGGEEIGGSAVLVAMGERRILVDAGMRPDGGGPRDLDALLREPRIDAVVVTHAHNDHAGYIPALMQKFPSASILASKATAGLLPIMWDDSVKVMERNVEVSADGQAHPPLYGEAEVEQAEQRIKDLIPHRAYRIGDIELTMFPAGHILGASGVVVSGGGHRVVVTGDITAPTEEHLAVEPTHFPTNLVRGASLLVMESTYCHGAHANRRHEIASLVDHVKSVVDRRGRVLIPAFGLGRAQEVAMILARELPEVEVLVDGLAKKISQYYEAYSQRVGRPVEIFASTGRVRPVENRSREMQAFQSGVIISTSGMLNGGPAVEWAKSILPDAHSALLLCGFQDEEAPGRRLENLAQRGERKIELPDIEEGTVMVDVRAQVRRYRLSAHADRPGLLDIASEIAPQLVMLVHGERRHQEQFRSILLSKGHATVPTRALQLP